MTDAAMPLDREAMRLVAQVGFLGVQTGQFAPSRALFSSLRVLRPESTLPFIGLAMTELASGRANEAVVLLQGEALPRHPGDTELMAFLGMALKNAGRTDEARKVLAAVVDGTAGDDTPHMRMAAKLLAEDSLQASPESLMPRFSQSTSRS